MIDLNILRQIPLFSKLSDEQFEFVELGRERWLESGEILANEGEPSGYFWVLLEGEIQFTKQVGDRQIPWMNFGPQSYFGHELILLDQPYRVTARAMLRSCLLEFDTQAFWKMMELCPAISRDLLIVTAQRTQDLGMVSMQAEKLVSLGTLTSGLAQELRRVSVNGRQAVEHLQNLFKWLQPLTVKLNAQRMSCEQQEFLLNLQQTILERMTTLPAATNPQAWQAQEEKIIQWLTERSIPHQQQFAQVLTRAGLDTAVLEDIESVIPSGAVCAVLAWLKTTLKSLALANDVESSTLQIAELVQAAKDYAYLDQAPLQEMDIHEGIERTLTILNHRLESGITIVREYDRTLPPICIYGRDLNQVWTHLIDNAIDAMAGQGKLVLRTSQIEARVLVEIIDNGPGIAPELQPYIFDQFFTTKATDNGTGLGLPIAYRVVVDQHHGQMQVCSEPGCTRFQVYLPMNLTESGIPSVKPQVA
ncbi:MAG: cyclic nucleotide-binding domain-containing protein [Chroococcidiopsidaceae cyanobacterium CP_BM_ER_R8_30]|nr:cyclic nucleotide-binding domain-containing protein [Chroococcidiopsidaceae cyanobacterium CP_BM_ER_R8_30]